MPKIQYREIKFKPETLEVIRKANEIIATYDTRITLRQLYYRLVAINVITNTFRSYKNLGNSIVDARVAGLIDWEAIEDRTREPTIPGHYRDPSHIIDVVTRAYAIDKWEGQENYVEVYVEKEALIGVFEPPCRELDVVSFACRGYGSATVLWEAAQRLQRHADEDRDIVIVHFGDHDPSGQDMTRDLQTRLQAFMETPERLRVVRAALNMDQIEELNLPPQPAKTTDARFERYSAEHGEHSWELDALPPDRLESLIRENIDRYRDVELYEARYAQQEKDRELLVKTSKHWDKVVKFLEKQK